MNEPTWVETVGLLRGLGPHERATAHLLEQVQQKWAGRVVPRHSMSGLMITLPGHSNWNSAELWLSYSGDVFDLRLFDAKLLIAADRCTSTTASAVLDGFLERLAATDSSAAATHPTGPAGPADPVAPAED